MPIDLRRSKLIFSFSALLFFREIPAWVRGTLRSRYFASLPFVGDPENTVKMICSSDPFHWDLDGSTPQWILTQMFVIIYLSKHKAFHMILSSSHQQLLEICLSFQKMKLPCTLCQHANSSALFVPSAPESYICHKSLFFSSFLISFFPLCCYENLITCPLLG